MGYYPQESLENTINTMGTLHQRFHDCFGMVKEFHEISYTFHDISFPYKYHGVHER